MDNKDLNIIIVVQARTSSIRFPGKIMMPLAGEPLLVRMMERVAASKTVDSFVVATTGSKDDDKIAELCESENIDCYRGHPTDLLDRHYKAGVEYDADVVIKIPSDCPLIDPRIIDKVVIFFFKKY